ncbi:MAG: ABC transporter ATP-binding protein/permease, partial [Bacteroidales bacterium]|nr:ABC transporter ATP-binding protein/permease [Bacteroidales bacterium]
LIAGDNKVTALMVFAGGMAVFSLLSNVCRYMGFFFLAPIRSGVVKNIRYDLYSKLIALPLSFFRQHKTGDILNRFGSDLQEVEWSIISTVQVVCRDPVMLIVFFTTLLVINYKMTLITLIVLPISGLVVAGVGKFIKRYATRSQNYLQQMSSKFEEAISGLRIIKGYNAISYADEKFRQENDKFAKNSTKLYRINDLGGPLSEFLSVFSLAIILLIGMFFVINSGDFTGEIFALYILVFARMIPPAKQISTVYFTIRKGEASAIQICDLLDSEEKIMEDKNALSISEFKQQITYNNISFNYLEEKGTHAEKDVLHHLNLTIQKGEVIAITGHSGGGKSTMVDLLSRFYDVTSGSIEIDGIDIRKYKLNDLRELFGVVNQDVILFHDTVAHNIAFGRTDVPIEKIRKVAKIAQADDFIMAMEQGYDTEIGDRGMTLSGGQRQRLSIARTLLKDPQVLIFDEATSALDVELEQFLQNAIDNLLENRTAIIIAHRLSTIKKADRIIFLENGIITESGSHEQLIQKEGSYYKFCKLQELLPL